MKTVMKDKKQISVIYWLLTLVLAITLTSCADENDPVKPNEHHILTITGTTPLIGDPLSIDITHGYVFVAEDRAGISITDRNTKSVVSRDIEWCENSRVVSVVESLERAFFLDVTNSDGVAVYNVTDKTIPVYEADATGNTTFLRDIHFIENPHAFVEQFAQFPQYEACQIVGVRLVSTTGYAKIQYGYYNTDIHYWEGCPNAVTYNLPAQANGFTMDSNFYYVASDQRGLVIMNWRTGELQSITDTPGYAQTAVVNGNIVYVADRQGGLQVIDATDKTAPVRLTQSALTFDGYVYAVDVYGSYLVASTHDDGVYLMDVTSPANPVIADHISYDDTSYVNDVKIDADGVVVASRDFGLIFLTIDN